MINLLPGLRKFSNEIFPQQEILFRNLAEGQQPHTMLITCSDSRIDTSLVTQTDPGELFVLRNAGNIVPPFGASRGGEEAAIEFAIDGLGIRNIVICGHSKCGAMHALSRDPEELNALPSTRSWLKHASATKKRLLNHANASLDNFIEENVLVQVSNLKSHPSVSAALREGRLHVFGWVYRFEDGIVSVCHNQTLEFIPSANLEKPDLGHVENFCL